VALTLRQRLDQLRLGIAGLGEQQADVIAWQAP